MSNINALPTISARLNSSLDAISDADARLKALSELVAFSPDFCAIDPVGLGGLIDLIRQDLTKTLN